MSANTKIPSKIKLHSQSRYLEISFDNQNFKLPCEYLRVFSPSAEVTGHGPGQEVLQTGKEQVNIVAIEPIGNYAIRLIFSDSHNSGLYSWELLYNLGHNRTQNWQQYLDRLDEAGVTREPQHNDKLLR